MNREHCTVTEIMWFRCVVDACLLCSMPVFFPVGPLLATQLKIKYTELQCCLASAKLSCFMRSWKQLWTKLLQVLLSPPARLLTSLGFSFLIYGSYDRSKVWWFFQILIIHCLLSSHRQIISPHFLNSCLMQEGTQADICRYSSLGEHWLCWPGAHLKECT